MKKTLAPHAERIVTISDELEIKISKALEKYNLTLRDVGRISESILRLSDFYITQPDSPTPWKETWAQVAYLTYFFPLNYLRAQAVINEGERLGFFSHLESLVDFGSGLGSGSLAISKIPNQLFVESSKLAHEIHRELGSDIADHSHLKKTWSTEAPRELHGKTLSIFSYALTELHELPSWALKSEALMIIEPATREDGRKLMMLRAQLIEKGFHIWAPCTHQGLCPLLTQSKTDWCHDRIHFQQPDWFKKIELGLPMKNSTLTTSYLLARKSLNSPVPENQARTVGDQVVEKGKTRQLVCRGPEREFLTWMDRDWKKGAPRTPRGIVIEGPIEANGAEKKANEIRLRP